VTPHALPLRARLLLQRARPHRARDRCRHAVVSAVVGVFTVVRSQSFAGHALTDVATTGGSGAFFFGISPLVGFIGGGIIGAAPWT
jgi:hypothetical protein